MIEKLKSRLAFILVWWCFISFQLDKQNSRLKKIRLDVYPVETHFLKFCTNKIPAVVKADFSQSLIMKLLHFPSLCLLHCLVCLSDHIWTRFFAAGLKDDQKPKLKTVEILHQSISMFSISKTQSFRKYLQSQGLCISHWSRAKLLIFEMVNIGYERRLLLR